MLQKCERSLGPDHRDTLSSRFNLAVLRAKQGKMQEAEDLYRQVIHWTLVSERGKLKLAFSPNIVYNMGFLPVP